MDLSDLASEFTSLRVSALSKTVIINPCVNEITIGPNAKISPIRAPSPPTPPGISKDKVDSARYRLRRNLDHGNKLLFRNDAYEIMRNIEKNRKEKEVQSINKHTKAVENFNKQQENQKIEQWKHHQALKLKEFQYQHNLILQAMQQVEEESKQACERTAAQTKQRQYENELLIKAKSEEQLQVQQLLIDFANIDKDIRAAITDTENLLMNHQEAKSEIVSHEDAFKQLCMNFKNISKRIESKKIVEHDIHNAHGILNSVKQLKDTIKKTIKEHYQKREQEAAQKVAFLKQQDEENKAKQAAAQVQYVPTPSPVECDTTTTNEISNEDHELLATYIDLQTFLQAHQQSYQQLLNDQTFKQFKFDCKKAINIPVNAISAVSSEHIQDKYMKLHNLLAGRTVHIAESRINAAQHPQGIAFAMDLLARKFVLQGDLTISSNPEAAFAYATVIVTLWNDFPEFGWLLLAHFHKQCPYLVPIAFEKQPDQSDESFYVSMGYQYKDGVVEKQDKFLKRMTGIAKLYFTIWISNTRRGTPGNPFHLANGWTWLARTLNQAPCMDITATLIHSFLEVAGCAMQKTYGKQFIKLVLYIGKFQLPLMKQKDSGGPVARLEVMLQEFYKTGVLHNPPGILSKDFW